MEKIKNSKNSNEFIGLIVFIFLLIVMFATNPNESDFKNYLKKDLIEKGYKEGELSGFITELIASPTIWAINQTTVRKNYYVLSIYTITIFGEEYSYIGIMNNFLEL